MDNSKNTILVCGGAGYIGSHVVRVLLKNDSNVIVVDDLSTGHIESIPDNVTFIEASIGDYGALNTVFKEYDINAVVHLCANAYVGESVINPSKYYANNLGNGLVLLQAMIENKVNFIVFSSSCAVYGLPDRLPIDENCSLAPINPYGRTKLFFEHCLSDFSAAYGLKYCALRYFNAAGAVDDASVGENHDPETHLIPLVLQQPLFSKYAKHRKKIITQPLQVFGNDYKTPDGTCIRDYVHVMDLAAAHHLALMYLFDGGDSVSLNLANREGFSVLEIIKVCEEVTGYLIPYENVGRRCGDPDCLIGIADKAIKLLDWQPCYSDIRTIIQSAWNWHQRLWIEKSEGI